MATAPSLEPEVTLAILEEARAARSNAYADYSQFHVGACLLTTDGEYFRGCNVENASFGLTICAERAAIFAAVAAGKRKFRAVAVSTDKDPEAVAPCGACRQVLAEFAPTLLVVLPGPDGPAVHHLDQLLPHSFGPRDLDLEIADEEESDAEVSG